MKIPANISIEMSDTITTKAGFGQPLIVGKDIDYSKVKTYGNIKKPYWFRFWKKKEYKIKMGLELKRLKNDFKC
jgi:hypothetical protein